MNIKRNSPHFNSVTALKITGRRDKFRPTRALGRAANVEWSDRHRNIALNLHNRGDSTDLLVKVRELKPEEVNARNAQGQYLISLAIQYQKFSLLGHLIRELKADVNIPGFLKCPPLLDATQRGSPPSFIAILLEAGANVNALGENQKTPLISASELGHDKIVHILLGAKGVNLNAQDIFGRTALMWAAISSHGSIAEALIRAGAQWTLSDHEKKTALDWARIKRNPSIEEMISSAPVNR